MPTSGPTEPAGCSPRPVPGRPNRRRRVLGALAILVAFSGAGCGGGWTAVPLGSIGAGTETLGSGETRLQLKDGRVFELRGSRVEYPYVWGDRFLGENMPLRAMRIDLREVARIEVRGS